MIIFVIPPLVDSVLVPELIYCPFQGTVLYEGRLVPVQPLMFRILLFMEFWNGKAEFENFVTSCWVKEPTQSTIRKTMSDLSLFLLDFNIPFCMRRQKSYVVLEN